MAAELITALLRFTETPGMLFHDEAGGLDELAIQTTGFTVNATGVTPGAVGQSIVIDARTPSNAMAGVDLAVAGTLHTRDVSIQALIAWDYSAQLDAGAFNGTLIVRGKGNVLAEYISFAVELRAIGSTIGEIGMYWQTTAGVMKSQIGAQFVIPAADVDSDVWNFFQLTCTRRWVSSSEVSIRYYINGQLIGDVLSADGDIGGSTTGTTIVGCRFNGGVYDPLTGIVAAVDELMIKNYEMSREEIEADWLRISKYQPDGYRQMREAMPPGIPISDDPSSTPQTDLRSMGLVLGLADSLNENMRANIMPDRAYGDTLIRWEGITKQSPKAGDSLDTRRKRVVGRIASHAGYSLGGIAAALAPMLACAPGQLQLFAFSNTITDIFVSLPVEKWSDITAGVDVTGGKLRIQGAGAASYIFDGATRAQLYAALPVDGDRQGLCVGGAMYARLSFTLFPANSEAGIVYFDWANGNYIFFGVRNTAGVIQVGYQRFSLWAPTDPAWVVLATTSAIDHYLRIADEHSLYTGFFIGGGPGTTKFDLSWSTIGNSPESDFTTQTNIVAQSNFNRAGFYFRTIGVLGSAADVRFANDFQLRIGNGRRPYRLYVYRDPAIPGRPDVQGANAVLATMKHGYTHAAVITSKSLLCDSSSSGCDLGPMGCL